MPLESVMPSTARVTPIEEQPPIRHNFWSLPYSERDGSNNAIFDDEHPLWAVEGFSPMARVLVDSLQPPPSLTGKSYAATAGGAAEAVADHVQYIRDCTVNAGRTFTNYSVYLQNSGEAHPSDPTTNRTNTFALCTNWDDRVTGASVSDAKAVHNPYNANGIEQLQGWMIDFFDAFGWYLESYGLPAPTDLHWDFEGIARSFNCVPVTDGSWSDILADARYGTELVDGIHTFQELWESALKSDGSPMTVNTGLTVFNTTNAEFGAWLTYTLFTCGEYALDQAVFQVARRKFPGILCGNYKGVPRTATQTWYPWDKAYGPKTQAKAYPLPLFDYASPTMYPLPDSSIDGSGTSKLADWLAYYNLTATGDNTADVRALYRANSKNLIRGVVTYSGDKTLAPWLPYPAYPVTYTNLSSLAFAVSEDDMVDLATFAIDDMRCRDPIWFVNSAVLPSMDLYVSILNRLNSLVGRPASTGRVVRSKLIPRRKR